VRDEAGNIVDIEPEYDDETALVAWEENWSDAADGSASDWDALTAHGDQVGERGEGDLEGLAF
jgi:hypothetical protein